MILYYKSNNGTIPIERSSIMDAYREESIYTEGRNKNLSKISIISYSNLIFLL